MPDQIPINTATATVKIVPDRAEYDAFKKEIESDFADFKEKFAGIFKVQIESMMGPLEAMLTRLERATAGGGNTAQPERRQETTQPDQTLAKLTSIESAIEDMGRDVKDIAEALTTTTN